MKTLDAVRTECVFLSTRTMFGNKVNCLQKRALVKMTIFCPALHERAAREICLRAKRREKHFAPGTRPASAGDRKGRLPPQRSRAAHRGESVERSRGKAWRAVLARGERRERRDFDGHRRALRACVLSRWQRTPAGSKKTGQERRLGYRVREATSTGVSNAALSTLAASVPGHARNLARCQGYATPLRKRGWGRSAHAGYDGDKIPRGWSDPKGPSAI